MCLQRVWWPELWLILLWILCLLRAPFTGANEAVRCERVPAVALGEDVTLKCNFIPSYDVLQVTWQKLEGSSFKNIATYSKAHGTKSIGPFNKRVCFNYTSLKASSITFRGVTLEDETCYKCIFNAFPHGSFSRETCLIVHSISAVRTELHSNASSPGLLTAVCSATGKPAPEITWKPEGVLIGQPEIHGVKNANGTVTITSTCNISVRVLRSKNLQALTCVINHPMGKKEKIIDPLEEYEAISAVRTELHSNASSPELLTAVCSATAKPAPEITWKPEGGLIGQPEIHGVKNANGTVTMTSTCNISVRLLRSKNHQALTCVINHPMGKKEKIIDPLEEYKASDAESRIWPVLCIISFTLNAIGVTIIILTYKKSKGNKPMSGSTPCTPAEKKNLNQDGGDRHQHQSTPKILQSVSYQNERQTPGTSQRKRTPFSKSKDSQRETLVPRAMFQEEKEENEEGSLNHPFVEGVEEIED